MFDVYIAKEEIFVLKLTFQKINAHCYSLKCSLNTNVRKLKDHLFFATI